VLYKWTTLQYGFHTMVTSNCAVLRSAYQRVGGFDKKIVSINGLDDVELASRLNLIGTVAYDSTVVVYSSFRRYQSISLALKSFLERDKALRHIAHAFRLQMKNSL
jgi:GT2 family glycosyltransferase